MCVVSRFAHFSHTVYNQLINPTYLNENETKKNLSPLNSKVQNGAIIIPKSTNKNRIQENFNIFDFALSDADMQIMHGLNDNHRLIDFAADKDNKFYPFNIEF